MARIEDVAMNLWVTSSSEVLHGGDWLERMKMRVRSTGNAMDEGDVAKVRGTIDIETLRTYRVAAGRRTREIVQQLQPEEIHKENC